MRAEHGERVGHARIGEGLGGGVVETPAGPAGADQLSP